MSVTRITVDSSYFPEDNESQSKPALLRFSVQNGEVPARYQLLLHSYENGVAKISSFNCESIEDFAYIVYGLFDTKSNFTDVMFELFHCTDELEIIEATFKGKTFTATPVMSIAGIIARIYLATK